MNPLFRIVFLASCLFAWLLAVGLQAQVQEKLAPPRDDAEAIERGLRFSIPLAMDPDPNVFWVQYADAANRLYYLPLKSFDTAIPILQDGTTLYRERDLQSKSIQVRIDPAIPDERARILEKLDRFEGLLRDGIKSHREGRRGPVSMTPQQANSLAKLSLNAVAEVADTAALQDPLAEKLASMDQVSNGRALIIARKNTLVFVIDAVLAEHFLGRFVPGSKGVMYSPSPLPPPAALPWTTANAFPTGPETTLVDSPHNRDGTIDYAAAFDHWLRSRVKPEDNAFALLAPYTDLRRFGDHSDAAKRILYQKLGIEPAQQIQLSEGELPPSNVLYNALSRRHFYIPKINVDPHEGSKWFSRYDWGISTLFVDWNEALLKRAGSQLTEGKVKEAATDAALALALLRHGADQNALGSAPGWFNWTDAATILYTAAASGKLKANDWQRLQPLFLGRPATSFTLTRLRLSRYMALNAVMQAAAGSYVPPNIGDMPVNFLVQIIKSQSPVATNWKSDRDLLIHVLFDPVRATKRINTAFDSIETKWVDLPYSDHDPSVPRILDAHSKLMSSLILGNGGDIRLDWIRELEKHIEAKDSDAYTDHMADMLIAQSFVGHLVSAQRIHFHGRFICDAVPTLVSIRLYKQKHGDWPESLEALVPAFLPAVPSDPFNGEPIRYDIEQGEPIVRVVGEDLRSGTDDDYIMPTKD